jgi:hypothetical protein
VTARKAFGALLIGAGLCCVVGAAYVAWGTAGALFVGGFGLYMAGHAMYTAHGRDKEIAEVNERLNRYLDRQEGPSKNAHLN